MAVGYRTEALVLGLLLIALGVLWTLGNMGYLDTLDVLRRWWPMAFVVWGAAELLAFLAGRSARRSSE
jgi:hypothetical protein